MLEQIKRYQFLFEELVKRDFKKKYKGTVLGMAWSVLNPLLLLLVMYVVFSHFFGRNIPHYATFIFSGNIIYMYFYDATYLGMSSLIWNAHIFAKVNVPKVLFILARNAQTFINYLLTVVVFFIFCALDHITFTWKMVFLLYPTILLVIYNLGVGMVLSALYVFFRDMQYLWGVIMRIVMYISAIFFSIDSFSQKVQRMFLLNPLYLFIRYYRKIVIDATVPSFAFHMLMLFDVVVALLLGIWVYKKYDTEFLYYI